MTHRRGRTLRQQELELIHTIQTSTGSEQEEAYRELLLGPLAGFISRHTKSFERRGLYDAESRIYEWICVTLPTLREGEAISVRGGELVHILRDSYGEMDAIDVPSRQLMRYLQVKKAVADGEDLDRMLRRASISYQEYLDIDRHQDPAWNLASVDAPSIQVIEDREYQVVSHIADTVLTDEEKEILHWKHFHSPTHDLSDAEVAEELNADLGERYYSQRLVHRRRSAAIQTLRQQIGLSA